MSTSRLIPVDVRYWAMVEKTESCWLWKGCKDRDGYGLFTIGTRANKNKHTVKAHRFAYETEVAPIAKGKELDHLCRVRACVNPVHLEPISHLTNVQRGIPWCSMKTHCPQNHPYDDANTRWYRGMRYCRACRTLRWHQELLRRKTTVEMK